jgi:hypothetical protein
MRMLRREADACFACNTGEDGFPTHSPHDAADERFIQQKDEKPCARDGASFPLLQFRSDT